eukprot:7782965-Alexandrium_andersonii.AAC.1
MPNAIPLRCKPRCADCLTTASVVFNAASLVCSFSCTFVYRHGHLACFVRHGADAPSAAPR